MKHAFKKIMALVLAVVMIIGVLPMAFAANVEPFTDVQDTDWYAPYVKYVYEHDPQLMNGITKTTFEPNSTLNRAMAAVVLYRLADPVIPSVRPSTFTDLTEDWYKNGVAWAQQTGVVNGISENKFDPYGLVTREQLVTMMWRYNDSPVVEEDYLSEFPDAAKVSEYAEEAFNWAISKTIINGTKDEANKVTLNPQGKATRAEFAKIISVFNEMTRDCEGNHTWNEGKVTKEATCTEAGEIVYACIRCGETKTEEIPALGHNYVDGVCDRCGAKLAEEGDIVIYYTNDVHTYIDGALSYDNIADLKAQTAKIADGVLLVDAGDHIQGTAYGSMDKGQHIIELMNAAKYDLATLGNHEFDYGMARALEITEMADFDYVSANFYHEKDGVKGENVLEPFQIFSVGGKKIAIIGITTPESFTKSTPAYFQDEAGNYIYGISGGEDGAALYADVQAAINAAEAVGADYIIALGHLGDDPASKPWTSEELIANTTGLDAFIDGHSHSTVEGKEVEDKNGNKVLLTQTGEYFDAIGKMTINADGIKTELITSYDGSDATVAGIKNEWIAEIETKLGEVIGHAEVTFDNYVDGGRIVRKQETNTGDFAADALYYLFDVTEGLDVDVAIMNGGGVRNKAVTGDLSYLSCKSIHTFGNVACLQTITGQQLLDALEWGARDAGSDKECGGFLQVSGITYEIHTYIASTVQKDDKGVWAGAPTGEYRVKNVKIMQDGEYVDLDLKAEYNLAGYNYTLRDLGDGFAMFAGAVNVKDYVMEDYMVLANYIKSFEADPEHDNLPTIQSDSVYAEVTGEGRITIVAEDPNGGNQGGDSTSGNEYVLSASIKDGDQVIIYNPGHGKAIKNENDNNWYLIAQEVAPENDKITTDDTSIVWTVVKNSDGTYSFTNGENAITAWLSGTYVELTNDANYEGGDTKWNLTASATPNMFYISSSSIATSYGPGYIECYTKNTGDKIAGYASSKPSDNDFGFQFYVKGATPDQGGDDNTGDDNTGDTSSDEFVLTNEIKAGDEVIIVCAAKNIAFSSDKNADKNFYNAGVAVTPVDGKITDAPAAIVWTVGKDGDNYTFSFGGQNIGMGAEYSSTNLGEVNDTWALEAAKTEGAYYIKNVGRDVYLEWYEANNYWSGYYNNSVEELFAMNFYVKGATPDQGGDDNTGDDNTGDDNTGDTSSDDFILTNEIKAGDEVIIVCAAKNIAFSSDKNADKNFYNAGVAVTPVDGKITDAPAAIVWTVGKDGDNYTFSFGGQNIGMGAEYSSTNLGEVNDKWALEAAKTEGAYYIKNVGRDVYLEWYEANNYWSGYYNNSTEELFAMNFYVKGATPSTPDTPEDPEVPEEPETGDLVFEKVTADLGDWSGSYVIGWDDGSNAYIFDGMTDADGNRTSSAVTDGKVTAPATSIIVIEKSGNGYTLKATAGYMNGKLYNGEIANDLEFEASPSVATIVWENGYPIITSAVGTIFRINTNSYDGAAPTYRFRFFKPTSSVQTPVNLYKLVGEAPETPDLPELPDDPEQPENPDLPELPDDPATGDNYVLTAELKDGDKVVIYNPGNAVAMSSAVSGYNLAPVSVTPENDVITTEDATIVWTVIVNEDGTYTFTQDGDIVLGAEVDGKYCNIYSSGDFANTWKIEACGSAADLFDVTSATLEGSYGPVFLEYYNGGFKAYSTSKTSSYYSETAMGMQFYVMSDEVPCSHSWSRGDVTTEPTCTEDGVMTYVCAFCGETKTEAIAATGHSYVDGTCTGCGAEEPVAGAYTVATSLSVGDQIILTAEINGTYYAMSDDTATYPNGLFAAPVTVSGNALAIGEATVIWTVCAGSADGKYTLRNADGKYISYSGSGTAITLGDAGTDFEFTCGAGTSKIYYGADSKGTVRTILLSTQNNKPQFRCYAESNSNSTNYSSVLTIWKVN